MNRKRARDHSPSRSGAERFVMILYIVVVLLSRCTFRYLFIRDRRRAVNMRSRQCTFTPRNVKSDVFALCETPRPRLYLVHARTRVSRQQKPRSAQTPVANRRRRDLVLVWRQRTKVISECAAGQNPVRNSIAIR